MTCIECKFWDGVTDAGRCRRNSPIRIRADLGERDTDYADRAVWPEAFANHWCGEFAADDE